ncbi:hypothetical protein GCM10009830_23170 [Glycomyces endophyticus]|uniref:Uncharacterized protein n=1 Tax=Glycomyces endophyticus TaxID=480996 RepID=A0ABP4SNU5_9ACTN
MIEPGTLAPAVTEGLRLRFTTGSPAMPGTAADAGAAKAGTTTNPAAAAAIRRTAIRRTWWGWGVMGLLVQFEWCMGGVSTGGTGAEYTPPQGKRLHAVGRAPMQARVRPKWTAGSIAAVRR